jgi:uncharacterized peroxidase-related enzyme
LLRSKFFDAEQVEAIVRDYRNAGLEPAEVALMPFAEKITLHAYKITPQDIEDLRTHGFSDADILDIILAVAARNFWSKVTDAVGVEPHPEWLQKTETLLGQELLQALTVGRPLQTE